MRKLYWKCTAIRSGKYILVQKNVHNILRKEVTVYVIYQLLSEKNMYTTHMHSQKTERILIS